MLNFRNYGTPALFKRRRQCYSINPTPLFSTVSWFCRDEVAIFFRRNEVELNTLITYIIFSEESLRPIIFYHSRSEYLTPRDNETEAASQYTQRRDSLYL